MDMISDKEIDRLAKTHIYRKFHRKLSLKDIAVLGHIYIYRGHGNTLK